MSQIIFKKETHQYFIDNKELISVSRIIDNYLGFGYSHIAPEVLKNASVRGKWVHKLNELYLQKAFLPLCTILILSHKCWEKPIYGLLPTFLNQT